LFGTQGITGLVNIDLTPEWCARIGAAIGAALPLGATVTANRDAHHTARMLKRALMAGLPSAGVNVIELHSVPLPVARYITHATGSQGGIHVQGSSHDERVVEIRILDKNGLDIDTATERRIEGIFFREDYRRAYYNEIGRITDVVNAADTYSTAFLKALRAEVFADNRSFQVAVDYDHASSSSILPGILRKVGVRSVELNANLDDVNTTTQRENDADNLERLARVTPVLGADMGVRIEANGERISLIDGKGRPVPPMLALAVLVDLSFAAEGGGVVAVPVTAPRVFETIAARRGGAVVRTKGTLASLMQLAAKRRDVLLLGDGAGALIFPRFYPVADGLFTIAKVIELLLSQQTRLADAVDSIPVFSMAHQRVGCKWDKKGSVMRRMGELYPERRQQTSDGLRIDGSDGWVLLSPDSDGPYISVHAEGHSDSQAQALVAQYAALIGSMQNE
jgi:mannose-1-phosphate guanylyltransferase/phosphomannomutase